jgi:hypothetical protein
MARSKALLRRGGRGVWTADVGRLDALGSGVGVMEENFLGPRCGVQSPVGANVSWTS